MIKEYFRPATVSEALALLDRKNINTIPLAGGNGINKWGNDENAVVDIQNLGWNIIKENSTNWEVGATVTLQQIVEFKDFPMDLKEAARREATLNIRNIATIGGTIAKKHNPSSLTLALLAMNSQMIWEPENSPVSLGDWHVLREKDPRRKLIKAILIDKNVKFYFSCIGRSPEDAPLLMIGMAGWPNGRVRAAVGGSHFIPTVVVDGVDGEGIEKAVASFLVGKGNETVTEEYLQSVGETISKRLTDKIMASGKE